MEKSGQKNNDVENSRECLNGCNFAMRADITKITAVLSSPCNLHNNRGLKT